MNEFLGLAGTATEASRGISHVAQTVVVAFRVAFSLHRQVVFIRSQKVLSTYVGNTCPSNTVNSNSSIWPYFVLTQDPSSCGCSVAGFWELIFFGGRDL